MLQQLGLNRDIAMSGVPVAVLTKTNKILELIRFLVSFNSKFLEVYYVVNVQLPVKLLLCFTAVLAFVAVALTRFFALLLPVRAAVVDFAASPERVIRSGDSSGVKSIGTFTTAKMGAVCFVAPWCYENSLSTLIARRFDALVERVLFAFEVFRVSLRRTVHRTVPSTALASRRNCGKRFSANGTLFNHGGSVRQVKALFAAIRIGVFFCPIARALKFDLTVSALRLDSYSPSGASATTRAIVKLGVAFLREAFKEKLATEVASSIGFFRFWGDRFWGDRFPPGRFFPAGFLSKRLHALFATVAMFRPSEFRSTALNYFVALTTFDIFKRILPWHKKTSCQRLTGCLSRAYGHQQEALQSIADRLLPVNKCMPSTVQVYHIGGQFAMTKACNLGGRHG